MDNIENLVSSGEFQHRRSTHYKNMREALIMGRELVEHEDVCAINDGGDEEECTF